MGTRRMCISMFHPVDFELQALKKYYGKENLSDGEFIRWLIHYLYLSLEGR